MPRTRAFAALTVLAAAGLAVVANAATPARGHIGPSNPTLSYMTSTQVTVADGLLVGVEGVFTCPSAKNDPADITCDHYTMTVDVKPTYWLSHHGGVEVTVPQDFYGYAYNSEGKIAAASQWTGKPHLMTIPDASGTYEIRLAAYADFGPEPVTVKFQSAKGAIKPLSGDDFHAYHGKLLVTQPKARPENTAIPYSGPKLRFQATDVGRGAAEPTIGVDKKGRAFFVAAAFDALPKNPANKQEPRTVVLRSTDNNKSWQETQPGLLGNIGDGHPLSLDPYMYVDPTYGRVFDIDLLLAGSYISFTDDGGKTWTKGAAISVFGANDHQTLFAAPPTAGEKTLDPKFPEVVYYCVNQIDGSFCNRSLDGGRTFTNTGTPAFPPASTNPQQGALPFCGGLHGHGVGDAQGRIYLPRGFCGRPEIAISSDGGLTWKRVEIGGTQSDIGETGQQSSVAVDPQGNLYYVWYDDVWKLPYLSISHDHGLHWSTPRMIAPPGVKAVDFPSIDVGSAGHIAITFPGTLESDSNDLTRPWFSYVVESTNALSKNPTFLSVVANIGGLAHPVHRGDCDGRCGRMYDFLDVVVAPDAHGTVWATATQTCTTVDFCSTRRVAGYSSATGEQGASDGRDGVAYRQISGPAMVIGPRPQAG